MSIPYTQLYVHLVWATWNRQPWITEDVRLDLFRIIAERCALLRCPAVAVGGVADHVHVLVRMRPAVAISDLVGAIKGASSNWMNHHLPPHDGFRWQGSYGALSLHGHDVDTVVRYIHNQPARHARQEILPRWEMTVDDS